ncbi:MAG: T9SS type A sorting domain-containing protein, partial [Ignavibacteria bacterium]|nr:T9SS type A sorting domain-containing protein [Ignavibacteria bacterium]
HVNGITRLLKNQNATTFGGDVPSNGRMRLGRFTFLRGGQDFPGGGTIFGHIKVINNFNEVSDYYRDSVINRAVVDSHVTRVDAIYLEEASKVVGVFDPNMRPFTYILDQNFPNPFNPSTQIRFAIPQDDHVTLKIYDVLGREVRTLVDADLRTGYHSFEWDGRNNFGSQVSSGIYIYQMRAGKFVKSLKMMMLK